MFFKRCPAWNVIEIELRWERKITIIKETKKQHCYTFCKARTSSELLLVDIKTICFL